MKKKSSNFSEIELVAFLQASPQKFYKAKELARQFALQKDQYPFLRKLLRELVREGKICKYHKSRFGVCCKAAEVNGILRVNSQGYGFIIREQGDDIFVSQKNMGIALHKDHVRARLFAASKGKSQEGQIIEILERARSKIVGTFRQGRRYAYVVPDDMKIQKDIIISANDPFTAQNGQKVVAVIDSWEHENLNPEGKIVEILGFPDEPGVDILSVLHGHNLEDHFPEAVTGAARLIKLGIPNEEVARRLDLRHETIFTIDPVDAKDFDDAVSLKALDNGMMQLGVHIADVSYYVPENGIIDGEAGRRGTSVYLVDRVLPMLPERLSNELCSLAEGDDKLCYSILLNVTPAGDVVSYDIRETIIRSKRRFTYEDAQKILDGTTLDPLGPILRDMLALSKKMITKRKRRGSIDFDTIEVQVLLDAAGIPQAILRRKRLDTHRLIEEFMLLANETVAQHVGLIMKDEAEVARPFVYRIHEKPDKSSTDELLRLAKAFDVIIEMPKRVTPLFFQRLALKLQEHPAANILQDALLRTMMKAKYSTQNIGHFGLAYKFYTHFTSPIRRYPDLMVHRLLKKYQSMGIAANLIDSSMLEQRCQKASECEVHAQEAERASIKMKQIEFLDKHLGEVFPGIICRIVPFGIFVNLPEFLIDGMVHISDLADDYYIFDEEKFCLIGQHKGKKYRLGDPVTIRITRVDRNERLVNFVIIENCIEEGKSKQVKRKRK